MINNERNSFYLSIDFFFPRLRNLYRDIFYLAIE